MQSQTKTYNRGRNIVWGMWQRKPPMVIAGCSLLSFFPYRCYFSSADVLALIICCSTIVLCSCELQCAAFAPSCSASTPLCFYSTRLCNSTFIAVVGIVFITVVLIVIRIAVVAIVSFVVVLFVLLSSSSPKISRKKERSSRLTSVWRQRTWHIPELFPCCLRWNLLWGDNFVWSWRHLST